MNTITDQANRLGIECKSLWIYFTAIETRVDIGAPIDETMRILDEKMTILNDDFVELKKMAK